MATPHINAPEGAFADVVIMRAIRFVLNISLKPF